MTTNNDTTQQSGQAARMHDGSRASSDFTPINPMGHTSAPIPFSLASRDVADWKDMSKSGDFDRISKLQKRETPRAAAAFQDYCLMGPDRSLAKLAEMYHRNKSYVHQLQRWSSQFHWQDRVRQYDAQEAEKRRRRRQQELEQMDSEHALIGRTHLLRAVTAMEPLLKAGEAPFPSLVSLFKYSAELERLARGAATSRLEGDVNVTLLPKIYVNIDDTEEGSED